MDPSLPLSISTPLSEIAATFPGSLPLCALVGAAVTEELARAVGSRAAGSGTGASGVACASASAATDALAALPTEGPFATVRDVSISAPRGRCDVDFYERVIVIRPRGKGASPLVLDAVSVTGAWSLRARDPASASNAVTQAVVISLAAPVLVGKTPHVAIAFTGDATALAKAGPQSTRVRAPDMGATRSGAAAAPPPAESPDTIAALTSLVSAVCGTVGTSDKGLFASASGEVCVKCVNKVTQGVLFPLRRAFVFGLAVTPLVIPHAGIAEVVIGRGGGVSARTFDLDIKMLDGKKWQFGMLDVDELAPLRAYVSTRTFGKAAAEKPPAEAAPADAGAPAPAAPSANMNEAASDDDDEEEDDDTYESDEGAQNAHMLTLFSS